MHTERVKLRGWTEADRAPFAAMNADPQVMEHFPSVLTRQESDAAFERTREHLTQYGFGFWALEAGGQWCGFVGLKHVTFAASFTPAVEIGWRLVREAWGHGYASEAARLALTHAFEALKLAEVVSFTATTNLRSRAVMERIGMQFIGEFDHPALPPGHALCRHVLYRTEKVHAGR